MRRHPTPLSVPCFSLSKCPQQSVLEPPMSEPEPAVSDSHWSIQDIAEFYAKFSLDYDEGTTTGMSDLVQLLSVHLTLAKLIPAGQVHPLSESYPAPFYIQKWIIDYMFKKESFKAFANTSKQYRILDVGVGTGQSSKLFFSHPEAENFHMYGLDVSQGMLDKAKKYPFKALINQNVEEKWQVDGPFDIISCVGVTDFIRNAESFLSQVAENMKGKGESCFGVTFPESGLVSKYSREYLHVIFHKIGFAVERHQRFFGYEDSETKETVYYNGYLLTLI